MSVPRLIPVTLMPAATTQSEAFTVHVCLDLKEMEHSAMVTFYSTLCTSDNI